MIPENPDQHIVFIANMLCGNLSEKEIVEAYTQSGFDQSELMLLMTAGKLLCNDRKAALKPKPLFKRVK